MDINITKLNKLYQYLTEIRETVKLYHFQCKTYSEHKASDEFINKFDDLYDTLLEIYQGELNKRITGLSFNIKINSIISKSKIIKYMKEFKIILIDLKNHSNDFNNIRDEILVIVNRFLYLLTFN
jgi:hypothetical protein